MQVFKTIWDFFQNQILGMKWLNEVTDSGLSTLELDTSNRRQRGHRITRFDEKDRLLSCDSNIYCTGEI